MNKNKFLKVFVVILYSMVLLAIGGLGGYKYCEYQKPIEKKVSETKNENDLYSKQYLKKHFHPLDGKDITVFITGKEMKIIGWDVGEIKGSNEFCKLLYIKDCTTIIVKEEKYD